MPNDKNHDWVDLSEEVSWCSTCGELRIAYRKPMFRSPSFRKDVVHPLQGEETVCIAGIYKTCFDQVQELGEAMQQLGLHEVIEQHGAVGGAIKLLKEKNR